MLLYRANSTTSFALALAIVLAASTFLGIPLFDSIIDRFTDIEVAFEEGIEIIKSEGYPINNNVKWNEIKAMGIKLTEVSWKGFLQICERLVVDFGNFQIYLDLEARVMWVYADPS